LAATVERLALVERAAAEAVAHTERSHQDSRHAAAAREDVARVVHNLTRELAEAENSVVRLKERVAVAESRRRQVDGSLSEGSVIRSGQEQALTEERTRLAALETEQEAARENRVQWQVREAHVGARLRATQERLDRATQTIATTEAAALMLLGEIAQLDQESTTVAAQQAEWRELRRERSGELEVTERASAESEAALATMAAALLDAERTVQELRAEVEQSTEEDHRLEVELTEVAGLRRSIVDRIEAEWKQPFDQLMAAAQPLELDRESLEVEAARIVESLEAIGPVNPLAVEEHAEESKRFEFLTSQRDDLVAARQSLLQAIKEIDGTARLMFQETFTAVQDNFKHVFQTLFGGGECELRLANPDDPLESEIDIHAAPRGKRTQRIHLLSSGERTLVAVSLLFSIYLTKPSPFCLMDEVDAPLDDANVGRFTTLLEEFKKSTQFLVITHNPRTMQSADAVYGVTMQEPGVSSIVGVRLAEKV
jgi:chromosome segregation protein